MRNIALRRHDRHHTPFNTLLEMQVLVTPLGQPPGSISFNTLLEMQPIEVEEPPP